MALETNRNIAVYQPWKWRKRLKCNPYPTINNRDILMTPDLIYATTEYILNTCVCLNKTLCYRIAELLEKWKIDKAEELLDELQKDDKH